MASKFIHVVKNDGIPLFLRPNIIPLYVCYHIVFTHSSTAEHLG